MLLKATDFWESTMSDAYLTKTLEEIESTISNEEAKIALNKSLLDLFKNDAFNAIIGEAYLNNVVKKSTDIIINTLDPESTEVREALDKLVGVNRLKEFFEVIRMEALYAPGKIEQEQQFRRELTAESTKEQ